MVKIYSPSTEVELALIESILEENNIYFFVHNDHFGSLRVGPAIDLLNKKTIMVKEQDEETARQLTLDFLDKTQGGPGKDQPYSLLNKLRIIAEFLIFGWFMPGRSRKRTAGKGET